MQSKAFQYVPASLQNKATSSKDIRQTKSKPSSFFNIKPLVAFYLFLIPHFIAAIYAPIQDCDEVFNYWEPTHYLNHGYGLQTWEYAPKYAIRSWLYAALHAIPIYFASWIPLMLRKSDEFYFLRLVFAFSCAACETRLFAIISRSMNPKIAFYFLVVTIFSAGNFHAAVSYLPSSFAMYMVTMALGSFMNWRHGLNTAWGMTWLGVGAIIGWPFIGVFALPFLVEEVFIWKVTGDWEPMFWRLIYSTTRNFFILIIEIVFDSFFYKMVTSVPGNMVSYNIFSGKGKGPNIFGTEPWHFYIRNLLINFNVWFILAAAALPLVFWQRRHGMQAASRLTFFRTMLFITPFYLWFTIFTLQPHKEERFMYPAYPCLALNAAISLHIIVINFSSSTRGGTLISGIPARLKLVIVAAFILTASILGVWRSVGLATSFSAPLNIYAPLSQSGLNIPSGTNVCIGKEWYRFPSSYHLPDAARLKFIRSDFHGLLPGEFSEARSGFGFFPGAWLQPKGMNDENVEDAGKYTDVSHCDYLVDASFANMEVSDAQPDYALDTQRWEKILCEPFLDAADTGILGRLFWIPDSPRVPARLRRKWGEYCLLKRKQ